MPTQVPVTHHLDLHEYWLAKRGHRTMPVRSDINPADIPVLLPYLMIIEKAGDQFRYRLAGTAVVREIGYEVTGRLVGSYACDPEPAAKMRAIYKRVFTTAHPVFAMGQFYLRTGAVHNLSLLVLPLSDDGTHVNVVVTTLVARFNHDVTAGRDWLEGLPVKVCSMTDVSGAGDLKKLCLEWERRCSLNLTSSRVA
jgi:hypothetical protein